jgi:parallel beta-helix repeat protein
MTDLHHDHLDDTQVDAGIQRFLDLRAADVGEMPDADETVRVLQRRLSTPTTRRSRRLGRLPWHLRSRDGTRDDAGNDAAHGRPRIMFATTTAVAGALVIALAAGVGLPGGDEPAPPAAGVDASFTVAADGSGTHTDLAAALAAAADGDTIAVRPGTYDVAAEITADVAIVGDGEPEAIVLRREDRGPIMTLHDTEATITGLTLTGPKAWLEVNGGRPTIEAVRFDGLGDSDPGWSPSLRVEGGATIGLRGSRFTDSGRIDIIDSAAAIAGIEIQDSGPIYVIGASDAAITDSVFTAARGRNGAIILQGDGASTIEDSEFTDSLMGIKVEDSTATIRNNTLRRNQDEGIWVTALGDPDLEGNTIEDNGVGIRVDAHRAPSIVGNRLCGNETDLQISEPTGATLSDNTVCVE